LAIFDGKNLSAINFSAGCFYGKDTGKNIGGKNMKKDRKIKDRKIKASGLAGRNGIGDFRW
jgi:hypothetical protein